MGGLVSELGDVHSVWLLLQHVMEHIESAYFPVCVQAGIPAGVGDQHICLGIFVFSFLGP